MKVFWLIEDLGDSNATIRFFKSLEARDNYHNKVEQEDGYIFNDGNFTIEGTTDIRFTEEEAK